MKILGSLASVKNGVLHTTQDSSNGKGRQDGQLIFSSEGL